jgi:hypothetical protein
VQLFLSTIVEKLHHLDGGSSQSLTVNILNVAADDCSWRELQEHVFNVLVRGDGKQFGAGTLGAAASDIVFAGSRNQISARRQPIEREVAVGVGAGGGETSATNLSRLKTARPNIGVLQRLARDGVDDHARDRRRCLGLLWILRVDTDCDCSHNAEYEEDLYHWIVREFGELPFSPP